LGGGCIFCRGRFPTEVVDHVGVGALGAGRDDVVGWGHDAGEALFDRETGLAPGGEAAREVGDVLVAQVAEGGGERYDLLLWQQ
jgi:hypothetical protein